MDIELRKLYTELIDTLNRSSVGVEAKRILLELLAKECELKANEKISNELQTITEKGEMENGTELD